MVAGLSDIAALRQRLARGAPVFLPTPAI